MASYSLDDRGSTSGWGKHLLFACTVLCPYRISGLPNLLAVQLGPFQRGVYLTSHRLVPNLKTCGAIQRLHLFGRRGSLVSCKIPCYVHRHFGYHNKSNCWLAYVWRKKTTGGSRELSSCSGFLPLSKFASQS